MQVAALLCLGAVLQGGTASAGSSDGWTPIIPKSGGHSSGGGSSSGRYAALSVDPELLGVLGSSLGSSLGHSSHSSSYSSHVDHLIGHSHAYRPSPPPLPPPSHPGPPPPDHGDTCALYKAAMTQDLYFQYIQYKVNMPDLKEFTLCMWHKFYNHSSDHPLFSYAIHENPRAILSWVSATERSTYFSMSVDGHTLFRLNYPLRLNRWYHSCQSWNGRTGEWQVWVNAERVGRGFHNLLVNHVIKGGGVAITGQEQRQFGGGFLEGEGAPKGSGGMLGEITQLQMYTVALTAGKAYRDHKHHHGNYGSDPQLPPRPKTTTAAPAPETTTVNPYAPFLTNGQLTPGLPIFELSAFRKNIPMDQQQQQQQQPEQHQPAPQPPSGPAGPTMIDFSQLLAAQSGLSGISAALPAMTGAGQAVSYLEMTPSAGGTPVRIPLLTHPRPALDLDPQQHYVFKREEKSTSSAVEGAAAEAKSEEGASADEDKESASKKVKRDTAAATMDDGKETAEEVAAVKAAESAADVESQRIVKRQPAEDSKPKPKRESKRIKGRKTESQVSQTSATPNPADSGDVQVSSLTKRELSKASDTDDDTVTDKKKRQTISLGGGPVELGGDIDTSLLTQGLSGLVPHGESLLGGSYSTSISHPAAPGTAPGSVPLMSFIEFHGNHQQLLGSPSTGAGSAAGAGLKGLPLQALQGIQGLPPPEKKVPELKKETEPAEGEVMAVMAMCSGCAPDPFSKVNVISWQNSPKKLYSGVLYLPAKPVCRKF